MKKHNIILLAVLLMATVANAQRLNVAYVFSTGVDSTKWITLDSTAQSLMSTGDIRSQVTDIGFTFNYAGTNQTKFSVNKYGYLRLGNSRVLTGSYASPLGSSVSNVAPGVVTMPRYSNTMIDSACHALYQVVGDTGDRVLVVEMRVKTIYTATHDTGFALFQIQLYEATDAVRIVYGDGLHLATNYQVGFAGSNNDVAFIDVDSNLLYFANTTTRTNGTNAIPEQWRYYQITRDTDYCFHYAVPWSENFNTDHRMACWTMLDYDSSTYTRWVRSSGAMWAYRDNLPCNDWMVTPLVQLPDSGDGLQLMYDYKATSSADYGEMEVRLATYTTGDTSRVVDTIDFYTLLRTETEGTDNVFQPRGISLSAYAGMRVRIAFVHVRLHSRSNIYVDNVQIVRTTAPSVSINSPAQAFAHDTTVMDAMLLSGSGHGLTYSWQSTMASRGLAQMSYYGTQLTIIYTHYGIDTLTCIVSNIYGNDTSQAIVYVHDCTTVTEYPWREDFEHGLDCWHQLGGWSITYSYGSYEGRTALRSNSSQSYIESPTSSFWIMSQPFALPDTATLPMPELLWWMRTPSQDQYSNNHFSVRIAVVDSNEIPAVASFTTVYRQTLHYGGWEHYRVSLEAYAGQHIRIMLHNEPSYSGYGTYDCALIDQMEVRSTAFPVVELTAPLRVDQLDSNIFTAHLEEGDTTRLTFTWHSTMASSGMASFTAIDTTLNISYATEGTDTLTIIATNQRGSDTATAIVSVNNCPALHVPINIDFEDSTDLDCWSGFTANDDNNARISDINPWYRTGSGTNHYMSSNTYRGWLVTPAIDLPNDTTDLNIHWYQYGSYLAVFISTDSNNYFEPTDFSITLQSASNELSYTNGHHCYSLASFAGQRIRIGFVNVYTNIQLDSIRIAPNHVPPTATLTAPTSAYARNSITVTANLVTVQSGLTHSWHSTMASAGQAHLTPADTLLTVYYLDGGVDTITYIVSNAHGADTQQVVITVDACNNYAVPYHMDFDSMTGSALSGIGPMPECWGLIYGGRPQYAPHVLSISSGQQIIAHSSQVLYMRAGTQSGFDTVAYVTLPRFAVGLSDLSLALTYVYEDAGRGTLTVGYMTDTTFMPIIDLPAVGDSGRRDTVSLASVPDSTTLIALRWKYNGTTWFSTAIDDIEVFVYDTTAAIPPSVVMTAPDTIRTHDTAIFYAHLLAGDTTGLTYTWQSRMTDAGQVTLVVSDSLCTVVYSTSGLDTVILTATNAFGADTQVAIVQVIAYFDVAVTSADSTMGYVSGGGTYLENDIAILTAIAYQGYHFTQWNDGDALSQRQVVVTSDTSFTACFAADTQDVGIMQVSNADSELLLLPNPAKGTVSVTLPAEGGELSVIDMWGRQVWSNTNCTSPIMIDLNAWHNGVYIVYYTCTNVHRVVRLVVE